MIGVKGSKTVEETQIGADAYRLKSDPAASPLPFLLGGFLAAVVVYIRAMFSNAEAAPAGDQGPNGSGPTEDTAPTNEVFGAPATADPTPQEEPEAEPEPLPVQGPPSFSGGNVVSLFSRAEILEAKPKTLVDRRFQSNDPFDQWQRLNPQEGGDGGGAPGAADDQNPGGDRNSRPVAAKDRDRDAPPPNTAPVKSRAVYLSDIVSGGVLFIAASDLLAHANDADGDVLSVRNLSASGGTLETVDGGYVFRPDPGTAGQVQISYQVSDGQVAIAQMAHFAVLGRPLTGSDSDDALTGGPDADAIAGLDGDDYILGNGGQDVISGGDGDDHIVGGNDADVIYGGAGDDLIFGMGGDDQISGGTGADTLYGGDGADVLRGGAGADVIAGDAGDDILFGDDGADLLNGGAGADLVMGGAGDDVIIGNSDGADDIYDGGSGTDTIDYSGTTTGIAIDLRSGTVTGDETGTDTFRNFEVFVGGDGDDLFVIVPGTNTLVLTGNGGDDVYDFCRTDGDAPNGQTTRVEITDFKTGDMITTDRFKIYDRGRGDTDSLESAIAVQTTPTEQFAGVRYWQEWRDADEYTVVWINEDQFDDIYEAYLKGHIEIGISGNA